jgi:hypothetical protein
MASKEAIKKPQTAYFLWLNANRAKIQDMVGAKDFKSVASKASELWKVASEAEKAPFESEAKRQKEAFEAFRATPEGQKAVEEQKAEKKEEKKAQEEKEAEKTRIREEKQVAREKREAKTAAKAIEKDDRLKQPMTAYFSWLNDNRERIAAMVGGKGGPEVTKKGSQMWKELAEEQRKPYEDKAHKEKEAREAYLRTPEGAAALKAYKEATAAVAYKGPGAVAEEDHEAGNASEEETQKTMAGGAEHKRKADAAAAGSDLNAKKYRTKSARAGA